jgi:3-dehydroquinate synthase
MIRLGEKRRQRAIVFVDSAVARMHPGLERRIQSYFRAHSDRIRLVEAPRVLPGGEPVKQDFRVPLQIIRAIVRHPLCRHSYVVGVGGGAVLDAVGFAASLVHRGLRVIRLPTTALAQADAGVGVKTGINFDGRKNLLGTFAPPFAVLNDLDFLETLSDREWNDGIAEAFKVAIIRSAPFFRFLTTHLADLRRRDPLILEQLVRRCAALHLAHIRRSGDAFEMGSARPLDFAHWSAHKIEVMSRHRLSHGEAVACGMALDCLYASEHGWISREDCATVCRALIALGFNLWPSELRRRKRDGSLAILGGLADFREHLGGELHVTFPRGIGRKFEVNAVEPSGVGRAVKGLWRMSRKKAQVIVAAISRSRMGRA